MAKNKSGNKQARFYSSQQAKKERIEALKEKYQQKVTPVAPKKTFTQDDLDFGKSRLEVLFTEANQRIEYIKAQGFTSYAIDKVENEGGKDYFDIEDVTDRESLIEQLTRVRVFLNDKGSTVEGAILDTAQINSEIYKGKFGNQYNTADYDFKRFDNKLINEELAQKAFESYRKIEESKQFLISKGKSTNDVYGSENLIIALYDAEVRGMDSLEYGFSLLDTFYKQTQDMWSEIERDQDVTTAISGQVYEDIRERLGWK